MAEDWIGEGLDQEPIPTADLRTDVPHSARMYNYYLGGKDNFPADRAAAEKIVGIFPDIAVAARANRRFLGRAVTAAARHGIRRFLDIGTGLPSADNTHEVAQRTAPDSRVVYVDNDPLVLTHARALLQGSPSGHTAYVEADAKDPEAILAAPEVRDLLAPGEPVAVMMIALLHFFRDEDDPGTLVRRVMDAVPPGSMLALSHATDDLADPEQRDSGLAVYRNAAIDVRLRSRDEIAALLGDLEPVEPGLVPVTEWHPGEEDRGLPLHRVITYGVVAEKR